MIFLRLFAFSARRTLHRAYHLAFVHIVVGILLTYPLLFCDLHLYLAVTSYPFVLVVATPWLCWWYRLASLVRSSLGPAQYHLWALLQLAFLIWLLLIHYIEAFLQLHILSTTCIVPRLVIALSNHQSTNLCGRRDALLLGKTLVRALYFAWRIVCFPPHPSSW